MMHFSYKIIVNFFIIFHIVSQCLGWSRETILDPDGKYHLRWEGDDNDESEWITFEVSVATQGWIGFGVSPNGGMTGSDIVIGWIDDEGETYFHVRNKMKLCFNFNLIWVFQRIVTHKPSQCQSLTNLKIGNC